MKKFIAVILFMIMLLSFVACNDGEGGTVQPSDNSGNVNQQEDKVQTVKSGDKIVTDSMEITINRVELTYDVLPDNTSGFYTHYSADTGKVYIAVDASVTNKAKQNLSCDEIGKIVADYNNGYTYRGFIVVKDSNTGFTYANITDIDPLETKGIKWLIECPEEVETSSSPLFLQFTIDGGEYKLIIR